MVNYGSVGKISVNKEKVSQSSNKKESTWSLFQIRKNLLIISSGIFLLFTGYGGIANLQSTVNSKAGMGLASQAVIYATFCISALFLPKIIIKRFGCKRTFTFSLLAYCPYIASTFFPDWSTLIPSATLLGLSASLLWASSCTYLNQLAALYQSCTKDEDVESVAAWFFGISGTFYLATEASGNLITFFVLEQEHQQMVNISSMTCGVQFCDSIVLEHNSTTLQGPSKNIRDLLTAILLAFGLLAVLLVLVFMDPLHVKNEGFEESLMSKLGSTFKMMKRRHLLLLTPLAFYYGLQNGFYVGDITRAYIACAWGISHVGLVTVCQGLMSAVTSTASGKLRKYIGRIPVYTAAAVINVIAFVYLFIWIPNPEEPHMFFIIGAIWGMFNGIYIAQVRAFYGFLFQGEEESAFANYYLWTSIGHCLSFSYSKYLCTSTKLYVLIAVFCLSQAGYAAIEWDIRRTTKTRSEATKISLNPSR